jgi:hypothetical protein
MGWLTEQPIPNLKLAKGDLVLFNGISEKYSLETSWDTAVKNTVLYQKGPLIVTNINKHGVETGFHFSRFRKIIKHSFGKQLELFDTSNPTS